MWLCDKLIDGPETDLWWGESLVYYPEDVPFSFHLLNMWWGDNFKCPTISVIALQNTPHVLESEYMTNAVFHDNREIDIASSESADGF